MTPTKVGVCHVFPFESVCFAVQDTHHIQSPPEEGSNFGRSNNIFPRADQIRGPAVWRHNNQKNKKNTPTTKNLGLVLRTIRMYFNGLGQVGGVGGVAAVIMKTPTNN